MSTRLQVLLDDSEMKEIRRAARRRRMTVSDWVRAVLRDGRFDGVPGIERMGDGGGSAAGRSR